MLHAKRAAKAVAVVAVLLLTGCATAPRPYRAPPPLSADARAEQNRQVFQRVWSLVRDKYFDAALRGVDWQAQREKFGPEAIQAPDSDALYGVLNKMLAELKESHLSALPPRAAHEFHSHHKAAVGIRWTVLEGKRVVTDVVPDSPAAVGGVRLGWLVQARDGVPLDDAPAQPSEFGKAVTYRFLDRDNQPHDIPLTAGLVDFERRESFQLGSGIVYLRFDAFNHRSLSWFSDALKANHNSSAAIIDLRSNSGGSLISLVLALGECLDSNLPIGTVVRRSGRSSDWSSHHWFAARYPGRIVLLVDRYTASAAEIFAHVLQHHGRAIVVGRKTAGAVIAARFFGLPDGGTLEIPVEDYVGLDEKRLEGKGVIPDIPVTVTLTDLRAARDPDVAAALEALR